MDARAGEFASQIYCCFWPLGDSVMLGSDVVMTATSRVDTNESKHEVPMMAQNRTPRLGFIGTFTLSKSISM